MPRLFVEVEGGSGVRILGGPPGSGDPLDPELALPRRISGRSGRFDVPTPGRFVVRIERDDQAGLPLQVELSLGSGASFPHGRPAAMTLVRARGRGRDVHRLTVRLGEPAEVVFVSGQNPALPELFRDKALHRFRYMLRHRQLPDSCVLTLFHCENLPDARTFDQRYRLTKQTYAARRGGGPAWALMTSATLPFDRTHVRTVYEHLAEAGHRRPRQIREFGFLGHAYWMGPVMFNTNRPPSADDQESWVSRRECHALCPTDRPHHHLGTMAAPRIHGTSQPYGLHDFAATGTRRPDGTLEVHYVLGTYRYGALMDFGLAEGSTAPDHRRFQADLDPRNTDFCDPSMLPGIDRADLREALHDDGIVRVWGCNNGIMGGAFRKLHRSLDRHTENKLLDITNSRHGHGGRPQAHQQWRVRQGDAKLLFLSRAHRGYPQVAASVFERPCYGTVPGTYGAYQHEDLLGAMNAEMSRSMATLARWGLYPEGVPHGEAFIDHGGYFRFDPRPTRVPWTVRVLVTGFVPFHGRSINASQRVVRALQRLGVDHLRGRLQLDAARPLTPPWLDLALDVEFLSDVGVEFSSPGVPGAVPGRGAGQVLDRLAGYDADIVVIVGEANLHGKDFRVERFGRNWGAAIPDNAGRCVPLEGPTFPGRTAGEILESTVPLRTWMHALSVLHRAGYQLDHPLRPPANLLVSPGSFVCNESFYTLLLEARGGLLASRRPSRHTASGRWIQMVHVHAGSRDASNEDRIARGLGDLLASYVLGMTWAGDVPGERIVWDATTRRPRFPSFVVAPPQNPALRAVP